MNEFDIRPRDLFNRFLELSSGDIERFFGDHAAFIDVGCPACGSNKKELALEKLGFRYNLCPHCGSLFVSPRPPSELIDAYYRNSEAVKFWMTDFYKLTAEARRVAIFEPRARLVKEMVARYGMPYPAVLADIGAGYGIFLEEVAKQNLFERVVGIEPSPDLANVCRSKKFSVIQKPVEEVSSEEIQASWATAFEVLEHIYDPIQFLSAARKILVPGGFFLFSTLTVDGFDIQVLWENSKSVQPPMHLNFLSVDGLELAARNAGFDVVELSTPGKLDVDIVRNTVMENSRIQLPKFVQHLIFHTPEKTRGAFQEFLQNHRLSSHVRAILRVPTH